MFKTLEKPLSNQKTIEALGAEDVAEKIFAVIPSIMQTIRQEMRVAVRGLTIPQFRILARLERGPTSHCDLADWIGVSLPAISRMINMLEERDLVSRDRQQLDRRYVHLSLTNKGLVFFKKCKATGQKSLSKRFEKMSVSDKNEIIKGLSKLGQALKQPGDENEKNSLSASGLGPLGLRTIRNQ